MVCSATARVCVNVEVVLQFLPFKRSPCSRGVWPWAPCLWDSRTCVVALPGAGVLHALEKLGPCRPRVRPGSRCRREGELGPSLGQQVGRELRETSEGGRQCELGPTACGGGVGGENTFSLSRVLTLALPTLWDGFSDLQDFPVHRRVLGNVPGLYPLGAGSGQTTVSSSDRPQCLWTMPRVPDWSGSRSLWLVLPRPWCACGAPGAPRSVQDRSRFSVWGAPRD